MKAARDKQIQWSFRCAVCLLTVSLLGNSASAATEARLSVTIVDVSSARLPCRGWVDVAGERFFEPAGPASCTPYRRDRSFSCNGAFEMELPAGDAVVHIERGKEFLPVEQAVRLVAGETTELKVTLKRWIDMPAEQWYSCDMHVHFGVDSQTVLRQLALADDVHVTPVFTYWLRGNESEWHRAWPDWKEGGVSRIDAQHLTTRSNIEIERIRREARPGGSVGASFLFNLSRPVSAQRFGEHHPTDSELCRAARLHSPEVVIDTDKPSWAETVIGAALGVYDTVQVCHNHYHRLRTIPGGYGMIGPLDAGESNAVEQDGLFLRTNDLYYRFLNCGFRLGVSGGSAIGVMAVPMGYNRVYAQIDGPLTTQAYWSAIRAGRCFATSGPMLTMHVNDHSVGDTIRLTADDRGPMKVEARLRSIDRIESLELVQDGQVVERTQLGQEVPSPMLEHQATWQVRPERSGWLAVRALYRAPDGRLRQAHTSPIYVTLEDKPIARMADANYMLRWIDRLEEVAQAPGRLSEEDRRQVLAEYERARTVYEEIASTARQVWSD